jgi:branched-subunit amino acid transport protein
MMKKKRRRPEMQGSKIYLYILVMASVTYLIRVLPLAVWKKEIQSKFVKSFLYYVPYACLAAMTVPAIVTATSSPVSGVVALIATFIASYREKSLLVVALWGCAAVFVTERLIALTV